MTPIRYPDDESVEEITARYLLSVATEPLPVLYGFHYDGATVHAECVRVDFSRDRGPDEPNPIHVHAAKLRTVLGPGMFGFGFVFVVFADQLAYRPANRHIPQQVRRAAERLPGATDLLVAATIDATGRQWWAVAPRHLPELDPVCLRLPALDPADWSLPESLDSSLWTAALALDDANHAPLLRLRSAAPPCTGSTR
ncbi:hypothetical protein [Nocardia sp. NBC_00416]|uniref:hypothetical protein n=1 Tax=Nocardia sp. NBC_00416 TaxID=2975991 RepID=UPI002E1E4238